MIVMDSRRIDTGVGLGLAVLSSVIYFFAGQYTAFGVNTYGPNFFPQLLAVLLFICSGCLVFNALRGNSKAELEGFHKGGLIKVGVTLAIAVLYLFAMQLLGFVISSMMFLYLIMFALGKKQHWRIALISISVTAVVWFIFAYLLMIPMPEGIFSRSY
ncbi:hypothetical protein MED121_17484 [Marinomonas sp. MED121]|nr:hypothetical protein MED121_17484 [Marinomonas sp. MED121]